MIPNLLGAAHLEPLARAGASIFHALGDRPCLLWQADAPIRDEALVADWLSRLPCPVLCVAAPHQASPCVRASDVRVSEAIQLAALMQNISRTPRAAAVFVQTLRLCEKLPLEDALVVESLAYASCQAGPEFAAWLATRDPVLSQPEQSGPAVELRGDGTTLRVTLNRPRARNAMSVEMRDALNEALDLALIDDSIEQVHIDAAGQCFSTGGELAEFGSRPDVLSAHLVRGLSLPGAKLARCASRTRVRVHGACIGAGIEFPAFAAHISATHDAWFQLPELRYGLIPGAGGCASLTRRIGRQRTAWLALSGRRIDARTALEWGLIDALA